MGQESFDRLPPVFIMGIARSGTTLLQSLLDGHPELLVDVADSNFFRWYKRHHRWVDALWHLRERNEDRLVSAERLLVEHIFNEESPYYQEFVSDVSIPELKAHFRDLVRLSPGRPKDVLAAYIHALGLASGRLTGSTRFWVDKTLSYEYLFYRYLSWWPEARFIFVVRDPRDVYTSYKKRDTRNERGVTSIDAFAITWSGSVRTWLDCARMVAPEHRMLVRYEVLVGDTETVMRSIASFLDVKFDPILLQPTKGFGQVPWGGNAKEGGKRFGVFQAPTVKRNSGLTVEEIAGIENLLVSEMDHLSYARVTRGAFDPGLWVKAWARKSILQLLNIGL